MLSAYWNEINKVFKEFYDNNITAFSISSLEPDSIIMAASPITSFKPPEVVEISGTPQAIASPAPKPKPSYKDGITAIYLDHSAVPGQATNHVVTHVALKTRCEVASRRM